MSNWYRRNWYRKQADASHYLRSLGVSEDVISYISSLNKEEAQILVNEIRKNPRLSLEDVRNYQFPEKEDPYSPYEYTIARWFNEPVRTWVLVQLKKRRKNPLNNKTITYEDYNFSFNPTNITRKIGEIEDWLSNVNARIESYSLEQAIHASDVWHEETAKKGKNLVYQNKIVVYGPQWKNKNFNGWTIQKVVGKNDLSVEGDLMNHCVSSYCEKVEKKESEIYSLRDPENKPHVTVETDGVKFVKQLQGNSNSEPKDEYKGMIAEWVKSKKSKFTHMARENLGTFELEEKMAKVNLRDIPLVLKKLMNDKDKNEYGLYENHNEKSEPGNIVQTLIRMLSNNGRDNGYYPWMRKIAYAIAEYYKYYKKDATLMRYVEQKMIEDVDTMMYNGDIIDEPYPQRGNYSSDKAFEKAEQLFLEKETEAIQEYYENELPGGLYRDILKAL